MKCGSNCLCQLPGPQPASQFWVGKSSTFLVFPQITFNFSYFSSNFAHFLPHLGKSPTREGPGYATASCLQIIMVIAISDAQIFVIRFSCSKCSSYQDLYFLGHLYTRFTLSPYTLNQQTNKGLSQILIYVLIVNMDRYGGEKQVLFI